MIILMKNSASFFSWHWDLAGFTASTLCAIHCLIWPFLLALPAFGSTLLANIPWLENGLLIIALVVATLALGQGYIRSHRKVQPLIWAGLGFGLIALGKWVFTDWEPFFTISGGLLVAWAHVVNWRASRSCQYAGVSEN